MALEIVCQRSKTPPCQIHGCGKDSHVSLWIPLCYGHAEKAIDELLQAIRLARLRLVAGPLVAAKRPLDLR